MASRLFFSLDALKPQNTGTGGSLTTVTGKEVPGFVNIAFANLKLNKRGSLAPIWHPNANKLGYCTAGEVLVSIRSPSANETFTVKEGDMVFIPQGFIHHIENISDKESVIQFVFDNVQPETMHLSQAIYSIADTVFDSTFGTQLGFSQGLKKTKKEELLKTLPPLQKSSFNSKSQYKYDIGDSTKTVFTKGGYLQEGIKGNFPVLQGLGILGFGLNQKGCVEPHWHTNAGELVFIVKGKTRITVLAPDGSVESLQVNAGEGAFAPASHFHNIENVGSEDVEVIAFFNNEAPNYIGIGEVIGSYPNELLTSVFNTPPGYWDNFKKNETPLVIVPV